MDKKGTKLKSDYLQLFAHVSKLYNYSINVQNEIYHQGKKEAYDELITLLQNQSQDIKHISLPGLIALLKEKSEKEKILSNGKTEEIKLSMNDLKLTESKKRKSEESEMQLDEIYTNSNEHRNFNPHTEKYENFSQLNMNNNIITNSIDINNQNKSMGLFPGKKKY